MSTSKNPNWSSKDISLLRNHFRDLDKQKLLRLFPQRSWLAIMAKAERLDVFRDRQKPRQAVNENYFKTWSSRMAYVLGFILADGCIIHGTYKGYSDALKFGVQLQDIDILEKIKNELDSEHALSKVGNAVHLCITSQIIVDDLKKLHIDYQKSLRETLPTVPRKFMRDFIRGVFDGDGGISVNSQQHPTVSVAGGKETITFIQEHFAHELGVYSKLTLSPSSIAPDIYLHQITYRSSTAQKILRYLYEEADLYLERKYNLAKKVLAVSIRTKKNPSVQNKINALFAIQT